MQNEEKISSGARKIKIVAMVAGVLLLAGCGNQATKNQNQAMDQAQNKNGVVNSIKEAMGLGKTMRCTYQIGEAENAMEMVAYIKGDNYATETKMGGQMQKMVYDKNAMYSWTQGEKKGTKMTRACLEELNADAPKNDEANVMETDMSAEEAFDEAVDVKCEEFSDADFSVPSDIEFEDQCEMMKNMMKNLSGGLNGQSGAGGQNGAGMPGGINTPQTP